MEFRFPNEACGLPQGTFLGSLSRPSEMPVGEPTGLVHGTCGIAIGILGGGFSDELFANKLAGSEEDIALAAGRL